MDAMLRRRLMMQPQSFEPWIPTHNLPAGYTEKHFISVPRNASEIHTGVTIDANDYGFNLICKNVNGRYSRCVGMLDNSGVFGLGCGTANTLLSLTTYSSISRPTPFIFEQDDELNVKINYYGSGVIDINDTITYTGVGSRPSNLEFLVCGVQRESNVEGVLSTWDFSVCEITKGNSLLRQYVACKRDSDGQDGIYETINDTFHIL